MYMRDADWLLCLTGAIRVFLGHWMCLVCVCVFFKIAQVNFNRSISINGHAIQRLWSCPHVHLNEMHCFTSLSFFLVISESGRETCPCVDPIDRRFFKHWSCDRAFDVSSTTWEKEVSFPPKLLRSPRVSTILSSFPVSIVMVECPASHMKMEIT